ncbi:aspartate kinase [Gammaproteobacteria bacterium]|nr:aspartate kinase [Gammaproteobacteria bacterium]
MLIVEKFGGTSVGTVERINAVADRVIRTRDSGAKVIVVVSAMSGETNRLISLGKEVNPSGSAREMDMLVTTGEQVTIALLAMALQQKGVDAVSFTGAQVRILTDDVSGKARILDINRERLQSELDRGRVIVVAGFQGVSEGGIITTLGRGGSDTTAVALAAAMQADECRIYTDVDGIYTCDPRIVSNARRLDHITVEEMLELASLGAKVLQTRSVEFAGKYRVPLRVLSSFEEGSGTLITYEEADVEQPLIAGITYSRDEAIVTLRGIPDQPGVAYSVLQPISEANINVDMIIQTEEEDGTTDFTFTVPRSDYVESRNILEHRKQELSAIDVIGHDDVVKVSVVGVGMRSHTGVATQMFAALSKEGINIQLISTSEIKISVVIEEKYCELALRALHDAFELEKTPVEV